GAELRVELADGSTVSTKQAFVVSQGARNSKRTTKFETTLELCEWRWSGSDVPVAWVGILKGAVFKAAYNLVIESKGRYTHNSLRVEGHSNWHLVPREAPEPKTCIVIVDTKGGPIDRMDLW